MCPWPALLVAVRRARSPDLTIMSRSLINHYDSDNTKWLPSAPPLRA